jgi:hypothetical protein
LRPTLPRERLLGRIGWELAMMVKSPTTTRVLRTKGLLGLKSMIALKE